ncbi:winged helix-turn-helix transcriptional regulator [Limosilactobacillus sp. STM2_1]|uniref:Winged helix-turn-helix transcriptional regulator n=1 Tax=Limosilactobacillus rudii TaxID=2759755 RepID=A0A7W3YND2_9LACO|nr:MarR family winged helix-turn-helix transcriptional regulator [Limosilactobacillus rudii]MBB1079469.1 winged helix-turn-helix transcriptional regulator [Limosilactobacillus rudii]MBB1097515.1 winged helix-turn-helix transcriptional regulator [Limosilactobacillus rudii]MCD7134625.1 MarR family winged helix-turn-helix transcriptional regulator [Limosilactobacillus rudii]
MMDSERLIRELFSFSNELHQKTVQAHQAHSSFIGRGKILCLLAKNEYIYQNQLAKLAKIKPGSLTQILEKMEREELIIRERDKNDRRLIYVKLSSAGRRQLEKNKEYHRDFQKFITAPLSSTDIEQFIKTLTILRGRFDEYIKQKEMGKR